MANQQPKLSQMERVLRLATISAFIPALALGIAASVVTEHPHLGLLLIPMLASATLGLYALAGRKLPMRDVLHWTVPMADAVLAAALIGGLVLYWIRASISWYNRAIMLCTYATVPMLSNLAIHLFFALRSLKSAFLLSAMLAPSTCPHCQHSLRVGAHASDYSLPSEAGSHHNSPKILYAAVPVQENEDDAAATPRPSTTEFQNSRESCDDESARLV